MMQITHGMVYLQGEQKVSATVQLLVFFDFTQSPATPRPTIGVMGALTITNVPEKRNFAKGNIIVYTDGNNNNTINLRITSVIGPCKFNFVID